MPKKAFVSKRIEPLQCQNIINTAELLKHHPGVNKKLFKVLHFRVDPYYKMTIQNLKNTDINISTLSNCITTGQNRETFEENIAQPFLSIIQCKLCHAI